ncbi:MAG: M3 family oligoendopeptidase [Anaerolineales bacterium]
MPYAQARWKLDALIPASDPEAVEAVIARYQKAVKKFESWHKKLRPGLTVKEFQALLKDQEKMDAEASRLYAFAQLSFYSDTQDGNAAALLGRVQSLVAEATNRVLFFSLWWKELDDRNAARLMKSAGDLRYWLEKMRQYRPYTLSEAEEKVINLKDVSGFQALDNLYDTLTSNFKFTLEVNGEKKTLREDELSPYIQGPDPALRAAAYQERFRVYAENAAPLSRIYSAMMRDWRNENVNLRKFKGPLAVRNLSNDIPDIVVETLLGVIQKNSQVFQRYFRLKAKWLGMEKLRRYDIYAPLSKSDKKFEYDAAVELVLETFGNFSPEMGQLARQVFDDGHVDAELRPGKSGGAFCAGILPGMSPWVLLNYTGRARDVAVVAHEMGHAIHALFAAHHSQLTFHSSLPMAETASVFSEMLLTDRLLAEEKDPAVRRDLLNEAISNAYATVGRQGYFALWEKRAHEMIHQGKTVDEMATQYLASLHDQFGDALEISDEFKWEWIAIPHFYGTPFYVYAYSFGQLLVLALYQMYKREGEAFKPKYLKVLSYGGAEAPTRILKEAGINIASEKFWQGGFDAISGMIDELEKLA